MRKSLVKRFFVVISALMLPMDALNCFWANDHDESLVG
jgi:hypothetical protein